jgi:O-antigen ligase
MKKQLLLESSKYSYFLMMLFLPISLLLDNIFLGILFLSIVFNFRNSIKNNVLYYLLAFFLFTLVNGMFNNVFLVEKHNYIKLIPFILIPFCLANIEDKVKLKGFLFFAIGVTIIQLNSVYGIINYYYFTEGTKYALKNYSKINEILNYERPYLGFFSALNIIICFYYFSINEKKYLSTISAIFSLLLIIIISARLAIIVVIMTSLIAMFMTFKKNKNIIKFLLILSGIVFLVIFSNNSLKDRFRQITEDARLVTWKGASDIFIKNSNYIFGSGSAQNTRDNLLVHYKNYDQFISKAEKNRFISKTYNTHNQYVNELLRGGFVGFLLLIIPQVILLYSSIKRNNTIALMLLVAIISFSLVENILDRQVGVYLYALLLCLTSSIYKVKE